MTQENLENQNRIPWEPLDQRWDTAPWLENGIQAGQLLRNINNGQIFLELPDRTIFRWDPESEEFHLHHISRPNFILYAAGGVLTVGTLSSVIAYFASKDKKKSKDATKEKVAKTPEPTAVVEEVVEEPTPKPKKEDKKEPKIPNKVIMDIKTMWQKDPEWRWNILGFNTDAGGNIGNYGCLVTVLSMLEKALGKKETPATLNEKFIENHTYSSQGFLNWEDALQTLSLKPYYMSTKYSNPVDDEGLNKMMELLSQGRPLVIEVDRVPDGPYNISYEQHFILGVGYNRKKQILFANDPWTGKRIEMGFDEGPYGGVRKAVISFRAIKERVSLD
jgi:hypothetical protein